MTELVTHRGPDDDGFFTATAADDLQPVSLPGVALGHRRLSIIDLAGGHQPLANEDETVWIVFNGEIYNYRELRQRLQGAGHQFRTDSDTEVIVHLYEDLGTDCFNMLNGMFALAIWDARQRQLVLARDRLGKKPLVYCQQSERLLFASELKCLLAVPDVSREISPQAIDCYLTYQYVPHPQTIFRGIQKLPPGHVAIWRDGQLTVQRYWDPPLNRQVELPAAEYRRQLNDVLRDAVRLRLRSDVPLGAFLSGGMDSSIIVALAQAELEQPLRTFSIGFNDPQFDETSYARAVAEKLGTVHQEFRVEPHCLEVLPRLIWNYDEPFADSSAIPTWYVSQLARQQVTVALTGDGGDELFAGYDRYRAVQLAAYFDRLPAPLRRALAAQWFWNRVPAGGPQRSFWRRARRVAEALQMSPERRYLEWVSIFNQQRRAELYREDFVERLPDRDPADFLAAAYARMPARDFVTATSLVDLVTYLPGDLMTKVDIASMAHGLECRQPLLDYRVVELAAVMPLELKLRRGRGKRILLETFGHLLPEVVRGRGKMGFGVPLGSWFRGELRSLAHDSLLAGDSVSLEWFRREAIEKLLLEHDRREFDHGYRLWALLVLELWHRQWAAVPALAE